MKRSLFAILVLFFILLSLSAPTEAASPEPPLAVVGAGSDFQYRTKTYGGVTYDTMHEANQALLERLLGRAKAEHSRLDDFFFLGDYDAQYYTAEASGKGLAAARQSLKKVFGTVPSLAVQGNHDPAETPGLSPTGSYDRTHYGVYLINEDDFSWCGGNPDQARATAAKLRSYLTQKLESGYTGPVFVLNHLPLHHSHRVGQGADITDNRYARALVDVLNEAGQQGLRIIYLFGHNHSGSYDAYLGSDSICLTPGTVMPVTDPSGGTIRDYQSVTLHFTYLNAGYLGYVNGNCSTTVFEIYEDRVELYRYDEQGRCDLKNPGVSQPDDQGWSALTNRLESPYVTPLSDLRPKVVQNTAAQRLNVGEAGQVTLECDGGTDYQWKSLNPQVLQVHGNGPRGTLTGVAPGTAWVKVTVRGSATAPAVQYLKVTVVPKSAVQGKEKSSWLWTNGEGHMAAGSAVNGGTVTVMTDGICTTLPVAREMLSIAPLSCYVPGTYRCTLTYQGQVVKKDFTLTVTPPASVPTDTRLLQLGDERYYLRGGVFDGTISGLVKYEHQWYFLLQGRVAREYSGFVNYGGEQYYVNNGIARTDFTGLMAQGDRHYYLVKGKLAARSNGLVKIQGSWYYLQGGRVSTETTTLVKHSGSWYYIQKGQLASNANTLVKYQGEWFCVLGGKVASQTTTLMSFNGGWYYVYKGKVAAKTTTLVKYYGVWYYVENGKVNFAYNGPFRFNGGTYRVKGGRVA